jgi:hypothetical protein
VPEGGSFEGGQAAHGSRVLPLLRPLHRTVESAEVAAGSLGRGGVVALAVVASCGSLLYFATTGNDGRIDYRHDAGLACFSGALAHSTPGAASSSVSPPTTRICSRSGRVGVSCNNGLAGTREDLSQTRRVRSGDGCSR